MPFEWLTSFESKISVEPTRICDHRVSVPDETSTSPTSFAYDNMISQELPNDKVFKMVCTLLYWLHHRMVFDSSEVLLYHS